MRLVLYYSNHDDDDDNDDDDDDDGGGWGGGGDGDYICLAVLYKRKVASWPYFMIKFICLSFIEKHYL